MRRRDDAKWEDAIGVIDAGDHGRGIMRRLANAGGSPKMRTWTQRFSIAAACWPELPR